MNRLLKSSKVATALITLILAVATEFGLPEELAPQVQDLLKYLATLVIGGTVLEDMVSKAFGYKEVE